MKTVKLGNLDVTLLNGEFHTLIEDDNNETQYYLNPATCGDNKILFHYILDNPQDICDYVQNTIDDIPPFALNYLVMVLTKNKHILVRIIRYSSDIHTGFEILYDANDAPSDVEGMISYIAQHSDFDDQIHLFTEIRNGHQICIGGDE